jgi:hypothetical protein
MLFKDYHIDLIRTDEKTATRRDWKPNYARPNPGVHMATTEMFVSEEECDCFIIVEETYEEPLGELTVEDLDKEGMPREEAEQYADDPPAGFKPTWEEINGEGSFDREQVVDAVEFTYGGTTREQAEVKARELGVLP